MLAKLAVVVTHFFHRYSEYSGKNANIKLSTPPIWSCVWYYIDDVPI